VRELEIKRVQGWESERERKRESERVGGRENERTRVRKGGGAEG